MPVAKSNLSDPVLIASTLSGLLEEDMIDPLPKSFSILSSSFWSGVFSAIM